jgi:hypothetical protein
MPTHITALQRILVEIAEKIPSWRILHRETEVLWCQEDLAELDDVLMHKATVHLHLPLDHVCDRARPCHTAGDGSSTLKHVVGDVQNRPWFGTYFKVISSSL